MKVHFLGIGGSGASAAAALAQEAGFEVTGCDLDIQNEFTTPFKKSQLFQGHNPKHLENVDMLVVTPAIFSLDAKNPELLAAKQILTWQQFLGEYLAKGKFVIAVCGTHGKTTTTAMIAQILEDAKLDPIVELGAINPKWGKNFRVGKGRFFVVEADEFNDNFLHLKPDITIVTNIEMDHPEYFKDFAAVKKSFAKFVSQSKKVFDKPNPKLIKFTLKVPGDFNIANASLAFQVGLALDLNPGLIKKSLASFLGVSRRFEYIGEYNKAKIYSDFGHHPTEIKSTIKAAREKFPKLKIYLFYQPHMFSRTKFLFEEFVKVFQNLPVDGIVILDIYPSREIDTGLVNSNELVKAINRKHVYFAKELKLEEFKQYAKPKDILFFMGAGDIDKVARKLAAK